MTRTEVRDYIAKIEKAIKEAGIEGIALVNSTASYSDTELNVKIQFRTVEDGVVNTSKEEEYLKSRFEAAGTHCVPDVIIGSTCFVTGKKFTITGAKIGAPKNCVRLESANGAKYVCPVEGIRFAL